MTSQAQKAATDRYRARLRAEGHRQVTLWIYPDTLIKLDRLACKYGSREAAVDQCIIDHVES